MLDEAAVAEVGMVGPADEDKAPAEPPAEGEVERFRRFLDNASPGDCGGPS